MVFPALYGGFPYYWAVEGAILAAARRKAPRIYGAHLQRSQMVVAAQERWYNANENSSLSPILHNLNPTSHYSETTT